jgi:hypothetical protein
MLPPYLLYGVFRSCWGSRRRLVDTVLEKENDAGSIERKGSAGKRKMREVEERGSTGAVKGAEPKKARGR